MRRSIRRLQISRVFVLMLGCFLPDLVQAAAPTDNALLTLLQPSSGDMSIYYLGNIFGSVPGVLPSATGQLLGQMFRVFNWGIIVAASSFMFYTIGMSIVNTANEGSFMGERAKGMARTLRGVAGVGMLVPLPSGYSTIQVFILYVCVQGVGLADYAWKSAVDYLSNGGVLMTSAGSVKQSSADIQKVITGAQAQPSIAMQVLSSQICMKKLTSYMTNGTQMQIYLEPGRSSSDPVKAYFGSAKNGNFWGACGVYELPTAEASELAYVESGFSSISNAMEGAAMVYSRDSENDNTVPVVQTTSVNALIMAGMNYVNLMQPTLASDQSAQNTAIANSFKKSVQQGWISAGSYYRQIGNINRQYNYGNLRFPTIQNYITENTRVSDIARRFGALGDQNKANSIAIAMLRPFTKVQCTVDGNTSICPVNQRRTLPEMAAKQLQQVLAQSNAQANLGINKGLQVGFGFGVGLASFVAGGPAGAAATAIVLAQGSSLLHTWSSSLQQSAQAPIQSIIKLGDSMVSTGIVIWTASAAAIFGITIAMSIMGSMTGGSDQMLATGQTYQKIVTVIAMALIVNGVVFSVYVPFIPFLLYLFAVLGWFMTVVEAVVAGPLVALGVTHPEGHDLLGKAEQSVMLLLSVFMRPICIIIGFFVALLLIRVAMNLLNLGFNQIMPAMSDQLRGNFFTQYGLMVIYTIIVIRLIHFCFAMIHHVPDKIMKWIGLAGGGPSYGTGEQQLQQIESGVQSGMREATEAVISASNEGFKGLTPATSKEEAEAIESEIDAEEAEKGEPMSRFDKAKRRLVASRTRHMAEAESSYTEVVSDTAAGAGRWKKAFRRLKRLLINRQDDE